MWHLPLKNYQRESLEILADYTSSVRKLTLADAAFPEADAFKLATEREYYSTPNFGRVPYVCLRIPTGGGKTLLAAHAVGVIGRTLMAVDNPACLWITPSTVIRDQTLRGLASKRVVNKQSTTRPTAFDRPSIKCDPKRKSLVTLQDQAQKIASNVTRKSPMRKPNSMLRSSMPTTSRQPRTLQVTKPKHHRCQWSHRLCRSRVKSIYRKSICRRSMIRS